MLSRPIEIGIGLATLVFGALLLAVAIPYGIVTPNGVRSIFLSPTFWPTILSVCLIACGAALAIRAYFHSVFQSGEDAGLAEEFERFDIPSLVRLAAFAVLIVVYYLAIAPLGMVFASMLAYAGTVLITGARKWPMGVVCAIALPLALYVFFYHVASVPIPQASFMRLP